MTKPILPKPDPIGVHLAHCYQGECEGVCKYGDDDCPAKTADQPKIKELIASVRGDLETVGRYYLEKGEQDLANTAFHLSGLVLALEVCSGRVDP